MKNITDPKDPPVAKKARKPHKSTPKNKKAPRKLKKPSGKRPRRSAAASSVLSLFRISTEILGGSGIWTTDFDHPKFALSLGIDDVIAKVQSPTRRLCSIEKVDQCLLIGGKR